MENDLVLVNNNERPVMAGLEMEGGSNFIADLTATKQVAYSSVDIAKASNETKKAYFNAINSTEKRLSEQMNLTLQIKDVYVEVVECKDDLTGEVQRCPRTVLIDTDGVGYQAVSMGVFGSLKKIFQVFGMPHQWGKDGLGLKVKIITKGSNKITTLEVA
jgi:hypothetical protein